ncbi:MAG: hypothetical protein WCH98_18685, partial [Verrucomicrobiota bacterium]
MNSPAELQIRRSLDLMAGLKDTAAGFALKEAQLTRDLRLRRLAETRKHREELEALESWHAAGTAKVEARFAESEARIRAAYNGRRSRIEKARKQSVEDLQNQAKRAKDRCLMELQMRHLNATRTLPLQKKAEDEAFAALTAELAAQKAAFAALERRVRGAFRGYDVLLRLLRHPREVTVKVPGDHAQILEAIRARIQSLEGELLVFRRAFLPRLFSYIPLYAAIPLVILICAAIGFWPGAGTMAVAGALAVVLTAGLLALHHWGSRGSVELAGRLVDELLETRGLIDASTTAAQTGHDAARRQLQEGYDRLCAEVNSQWAHAAEMEQPFIAKIQNKMDSQAPRLLEMNERLFLPKIQRTEAARASGLAEILDRVESRKTEIDSAFNNAKAALDAEEADRWSKLQSEWTDTMVPLYRTLDAMNDRLAVFSPPWDARHVESWTPPAEFPPGAKFASLHLDLAAPKDPRLALPGPALLSIPLALTFPSQGALLFETSDSGNPTVVGTLNNIILRLLSTTPPGKLSFTIIDPVGLGQSFSGLMHLGDYEETLINRRIWTQRDQ